MPAVEPEYDPQRPVIEAIQAGDPDAMAELIHGQAPWVRGVILGVLGRRDEVDDVAQRVWMKVWREARRLDDSGRWRQWLYRIARNAATDAVRNRRRRWWLWQRAAENRAEPTGSQAARSGPPENTLAAREEHAKVLNAIAELPPLYREPFVLRHLENWSYRQIGEVLGLPADTVETRLVRARRLLRDCLATRDSELT